MSWMEEIGWAAGIFSALVIVGRFIYWRCTREPSFDERYGRKYRGPGWGED